MGLPLNHPSHISFRIEAQSDLGIHHFKNPQYTDSINAPQKNINQRGKLFHILSILQDDCVFGLLLPNNFDCIDTIRNIYCPSIIKYL